MKLDKGTERDRYNKKAIKIKKLIISNKFPDLGIYSMKSFLRDPYIEYEKLINSYAKHNYKVLELGSGVGLHSEVLLKSNASLYAMDISNESLNIFNDIYQKKYNNFQTVEGDIENIPFENEFFDIVVSAGSMSYGKKEIVKKEIHRVLKKNGHFIVVDSLNNNLIYKFNRYLNYLRKKRTYSTLENMLSINDINKYQNLFLLKKISFFGSLIWTAPILSIFINDEYLGNIFRQFDKIINVKKSAFKYTFVMKKID